jgi:hypothetical protein
MTSKAIGGFLPLRLPAQHSAVSVFSLWTDMGASVALLHNARSALHALLAGTKPRRVWLPAYVCREVANSIPAGMEISYFPLDEGLHPRVDFLASHIEDGDHVLAVDYFGRPAQADFVELVRARPAAGWIQDCAHALDVGVAAWGNWLLYSPRKLIGVPDGGVLVSRDKPSLELATRPLTDFSFVLPSLERYEDREELNNRQWYATYVRQEAAMRVGADAMSRLSIEVLKACDAKADGDIRRSNYAVLHERLREWAFLTDAPGSFVPMGFPIRVRSADRVVAQLAALRIFAARHWRDLPVQPGEFSIEHGIAQELVTLPCDYRYGERDMHRVADAVIRAIEA